MAFAAGEGGSQLSHTALTCIRRSTGGLNGGIFWYSACASSVFKI